MSDGWTLPPCGHLECAGHKVCEAEIPEMDLPGMWSYSDFTGGSE